MAKPSAARHRDGIAQAMLHDAVARITRAMGGQGLDAASSDTPVAMGPDRVRVNGQPYVVFGRDVAEHFAHVAIRPNQITFRWRMPPDHPATSPGLPRTPGRDHAW